jgi:hypothetical protein
MRLLSLLFLCALPAAFLFSLFVLFWCMDAICIRIRLPFRQNMCDFDELRSLHQSGIGVIEASRSATWPPTEDCLAAFLAVCTVLERATERTKRHHLLIE